MGKGYDVHAIADDKTNKKSFNFEHFSKITNLESNSNLPIGCLETATTFTPIGSMVSRGINALTDVGSVNDVCNTWSMIQSLQYSSPS